MYVCMGDSSMPWVEKATAGSSWLVSLLVLLLLLLLLLASLLGGLVTLVIGGGGGVYVMGRIHAATTGAGLVV